LNYISFRTSKQLLPEHHEDVTQEANRLTNLVESGELDPDRVKLAARLHYGPAVLALEYDQPDITSLGELFVGFNAFSKEDWLRMAVAALRSVLPIWESACPDDNRPVHTVESVEHWILNPSAKTKSDSGRLGTIAESSFLRTPAKGTPVFVARAVLYLNKALQSPPENGCFSHCFDAIKASSGCIAFPEALNDDAVMAAEHPSPETVTKIITTIRDEVVPWALGYYDPIALRHSK